jgi:hypothetical protein
MVVWLSLFIFKQICCRNAILAVVKGFKPLMLNKLKFNVVVVAIGLKIFTMTLAMVHRSLSKQL